MNIILYNGNNMDILGTLEDNSVGSIVTDSPYGLKFMNHKWDYSIPSVELWKECLRVLKPGGHLAAFCGTRTQHRMAVNIEDAGFEIRDIINWLYGQGFPKSFNIANAMESYMLSGSTNKKDFKNLDGTETEKGLGYTKMSLEQGFRPEDYGTYGTYKTNIKYSTEEAMEWDGWGTALKPACELITIARKPISEKNIVQNILKWGTGAINIDDSRIELNGEIVPINVLKSWSGFGQEERPDYDPTENTKGRWPANVILDEEAGNLLDEQTGNLGVSRGGNSTAINSMFSGLGTDPEKLGKPSGFGDAGGASRFFYCAKPSKKEKNTGLNEGENKHPTVKPISLMKYLVKLITPFNEICLDPFMGSGTTGIACKELGISFTGIELESEYFSLAKTRIESWEVEEN